MDLLVTRDQMTQGWPARTGAAYSFQLTLPIVFFHRRELLSPRNESYRLVSSDGSYDVTQDLSSARPYDEVYAVISFHGLSTGARYSLYQLDGGPGEPIPMFEDVSYSELEAQPPPADIIRDTASEDSAAE